MPLNMLTELRDRVPNLTEPCVLAQNFRGYLYKGPVNSRKIIILDGLISGPKYGFNIVYQEQLGWEQLGQGRESTRSDEPTFVIRNPYATQNPNQTT